MTNIAILGSTGSIGTQTLDIITEYPGRFHASVLTARRNWQLLSEQARKFHPEKVIITDEEAYLHLKESLSDLPVEVGCGMQDIIDAMSMDQLDTVVTAMVGYSGLLPTVAAIESGKTIALANKETLVVAGELITRLLAESKSRIIPVDSEHSAIFQCLVGERHSEIRNLILTASGGPFRTKRKEDLATVTVADALNHPNWKMGAKVTIDSASMMNKGFEMIEARWLFDCTPDKIKILVHPQSVVHSMVEFHDGSIKAQLGVPDMHLPIRYALGFPERLETTAPPLALSQMSDLTFEEPDYEKFPMLALAFEAVGEGGNMPCILNAANEKGVAAFLEGRISFNDLPRLAKHAMQKSTFIPHPNLEDLAATNDEVLEIASNWLNSIKHTSLTL